MQGALPEVRPVYDVRIFRVISAVAGCFHLGEFATLRPRVYIMIGSRRLTLELPQILQLMKVGHRLGVPLLRFLVWKLRGAHVYGHFAF